MMPLFILISAVLYFIHFIADMFSPLRLDALLLLSADFLRRRQGLLPLIMCAAADADAADAFFFFAAAPCFYTAITMMSCHAAAAFMFSSSSMPAAFIYDTRHFRYYRLAAMLPFAFSAFAVFAPCLMMFCACQSAADIYA